MLRYLEYSLINVDGVGRGPEDALYGSGASFEGNLFPSGGRLVGYLEGTAEQLARAEAAAQPFGATGLQADEVMAAAERYEPVNTVRDGLFVGPASLDATGRVMRSLSETAWPAAAARTTIRAMLQAKIEAGMADCDTIIATPPTTVAQCSASVVKMARYLKRLGRLSLNKLDGSD